MTRAARSKRLKAIVRRDRSPGARLRRLARRTSIGQRPLAAAAGAAVGGLAILAVARRLIRGAGWLEEPLTPAESSAAADAAEPSKAPLPIMHTTPMEPVGSPSLAIRRTAPGGRRSPTAPATGGPVPGRAPSRPAHSSAATPPPGTAPESGRSEAA